MYKIKYSLIETFGIEKKILKTAPEMFNKPM